MVVDNNTNIKIDVHTTLKQLSKLFLNGDASVLDLSEKYLNKIALGGGVLCNVSGKYVEMHPLPSKQHGYGFRVIKSHNVNENASNFITIVLTAKSDNAAEYIRQGRVAKMIKFNKLSYIEADSLVSATYGLRYSMDRNVLNCVIALRNSRILSEYPMDASDEDKTAWMLKNNVTHMTEVQSFQKFDVVVAIHSKWRLKYTS